jgi:hypothetical protein
MVDFDTQLERNEYAARETAKGKEHLSSLLKEAYLCGLKFYICRVKITGITVAKQYMMQMSLILRIYRNLMLSFMKIF